MATLWHGRFEGAPDEVLVAYTVSLPFDVRLDAADIAGSRAHARGLERAGILSDTECAQVLSGLDQVEDELATGVFQFAPGDEDIHTAVERRLTELVGDPGAKIHTGRSRNDQVATDLRLYTRSAVVDLAEGILTLQQVLLDRAIAAGDAYLPGYTHLQRAQPVTVGHHLLAHAEALARDARRVCDALAGLNANPLGSGALAGTTLPIDRQRTTQLLGFATLTRNSLDAVSDRDHLVEAMAAAALGAVHLSRLGEELVLFASAEFGYVRMPDAFTTGSSLMPQKKNPDMAELIRGKSGRVIGDLVSLLVTLKGLPLAYNKDLQEDKEPLFDALLTWRDVLAVSIDLVAALRWQKDALLAGLDRGFLLATDLADVLVTAGVPFREAHEHIASLVADLSRRNKTLRSEGAKAIAARLGQPEDVIRDALDVKKALRRRDLPGAPHPRRVKTEAKAWPKRLAPLVATLAAYRAPCPAEQLLRGIEP